MNRYENHNLDSKALPIIFRERVESCGDMQFNSSNWHENVEIIFVIDGEGEISNNGITYPLAPGDIAVVNQNCLHTIYSTKTDLRHRYLIVDRSFCVENGLDTENVSFQPKLRDEELLLLEERLNAACQSSEDTPYRVLTIRSLVLSIMSHLSTKYSTPKGQIDTSDKRSAYIKSAIEYIRASYDKDISLASLAEFVGINESYLSRQFHKYTGYTVVSYLNYIRCKEAKRLLRDNTLTVSDVATICGFRDKSYFSKIFKRYVGTLPGKFRQQDAGSML